MKSDVGPPPPAAGVRIPWMEVPARLRAKVEAMVGGAVVEAVTQAGGFSPGAAVRLRLATGGRVFAKAVSREQNPDSPGIHRTEARIAAALPADVPSPRLLGSLDQDGWVVLVFEDVDGAMPESPWRRDQLERVVGTVAGMAASLDPSPVDAGPAAERLAGPFQGWRPLAAAREPGADDLAWLDPWAVRHLAGWQSSKPPG